MSGGRGVILRNGCPGFTQEAYAFHAAFFSRYLKRGVAAAVRFVDINAGSGQQEAQAFRVVTQTAVGERCPAIRAVAVYISPCGNKQTDFIVIVIVCGITEGSVVTAGGNSHVSQPLLGLGVTVSGSGGVIHTFSDTGLTQYAEAFCDITLRSHGKGGITVGIDLVHVNAWSGQQEAQALNIPGDAAVGKRRPAIEPLVVYISAGGDEKADFFIIGVVRGITEGLPVMAWGNAHLKQLFLSFTIPILRGGRVIYRNVIACFTQYLDDLLIHLADGYLIRRFTTAVCLVHINTGSSQQEAQALNVAVQANVGERSPTVFCLCIDVRASSDE